MSSDCQDDFLHAILCYSEILGLLTITAHKEMITQQKIMKVALANMPAYNIYIKYIKKHVM